MKQAALVIIKPDGISKGLVGNVLNKFNKAQADIAALKVVQATRKLAENHYRHLKDQPFFNQIINYLIGKYHTKKHLIVIIYYGEEAIRKCRRIAGKTNPEEASPESIRGAFGRITTKGMYENVVHVSSDNQEAAREIRLWFSPSEIIIPQITDKFFPKGKNK